MVESFKSKRSEQKNQRGKSRNEIRRKERREKSDARREAWNKLTVAQKLEALNKRPGNATKQRKRLLEASKEA